jgi:hypothetical protein
MSSELERRLEGMLATAPEPEPGAGEKALHRALRALQPAPPAHRGIRTAVVAFAAAAVLLAIAAGSLAAAGALHVSLGAKKKPPPAVTQLVLPEGANGIAAIVGGRLSVAIRGGFRLQTRAAASALSPHALFVAAGIGRRLVVMAPSGRLAWSHPAGGEVVAIAWAPDGLEIAYVVRSGNRLELHLIYGNGRNDTTIDRSVRAVRPSWRADSLAFAYVGAGGSPVLYDLEHKSRHLIAVDPPATGVAFAPAGEALAVEQVGGVSLVPRDGSATDVADGNVEAFGWLNDRLAVAVPGLQLNSAEIRLFTPGGAARGSYTAHGIVIAVTLTETVVRRGRNLVAGHTTLLTVPRGATVKDLAVG